MRREHGGAGDGNRDKGVGRCGNVANLQEQGAFIDKVILYGSYASGKACEHSDIDIAVISSFFSGRGILERQDFLGRAFGDIYDPIEPRGYSPEEYQNPNPGTLLHEIKRTGIVIYQAPKKKVHEKALPD